MRHYRQLFSTRGTEMRHHHVIVWTQYLHPAQLHVELAAIVDKKGPPGNGWGSVPGGVDKNMDRIVDKYLCYVSRFQSLKLTARTQIV